MTKKTIAVVIDLSAAHVFVWWKCIFIRFFRIILYKYLSNLLTNMSSNRLFVVHNNESKNSKPILNNRLLQCSVLAVSLLFYLYINNILIHILRNSSTLITFALHAKDRNSTNANKH